MSSVAMAAERSRPDVLPSFRGGPHDAGAQRAVAGDVGHGEADGRGTGPGAVDVASAFRPRVLPVQGPLRDYVSALMAVEVDPLHGPLTLSVAPHESMMLTVQLGRDADAIEQKGPQGSNTWLTGIRRWTGSFTPAGNCVSLFALLTPLGSVHLLDSQPLAGVPRIRASVADVLDGRTTRRLETDIAHAGSLHDRLRVLAAWLEERALRTRRLTSAALRAARAAMHVVAEPGVPVEALAARHAVTRRQLERDFGRWIGTSPRHLSQVARLQAVSRHAQRGGSLAHVAAEVGFADQSHMTRVVRQLTGLTPGQFVRSATTPMSHAFRAATAGGTVYL
jgi:AraC-like DNA-binding protein